MKLYQALTQVTINGQMVDDNPDFTITTDLEKPLHYTPSELYHYIDFVLKPGSRHDQNNLNFVTDAAFIAENFDFAKFSKDRSLFSFEGKMQAARHIVADLNRHVTANLNVPEHQFQLVFVD